MGFSWYTAEHAVWCCGLSAVLSFQSLWGEVHHQREMIESLSLFFFFLLYFHSFLLVEWINLYPADLVFFCVFFPFVNIDMFTNHWLVWALFGSLCKVVCVKILHVFFSLFSRRWYALIMSGVGENTSDPARAESRKRKECSTELLGPR